MIQSLLAEFLHRIFCQSPRVKQKWSKFFFTQHIHSEMNFRLRFKVIKIFMLVGLEMPRIYYKRFIFNALETGPFPGQHSPNTVLVEGIFCVCYEIRTEIKKMRLGKATGPGSISVELLEALEDFEIDKITTILNKMNGTRHLQIHIHRMSVTWME